jgi:hypothetical protein
MSKVGETNLNARIKPAHAQRLDDVVSGKPAAPAVAVRSSGVTEDLGNQNFAGVAHTIGAERQTPTFADKATSTSPLSMRLSAALAAAHAQVAVVEDLAAKQKANMSTIGVDVANVVHPIGTDGSFVSLPARQQRLEVPAVIHQKAVDAGGLELIAMSRDGVVVAREEAAPHQQHFRDDPRPLSRAFPDLESGATFGQPTTREELQNASGKLRQDADARLRQVMNLVR